MESTHSDTEGNQEKTDDNAYYQTNGYNPLVTLDGLTGVFSF
nr:transposase [Carnobacterium funditum]